MKRALAAATVLLCGFSAIAQNIEGVNARLDAMGGSGWTDDIGWTIDHPASIYKYGNLTQGTVCLMPLFGIGKTFGAIIGITKLTDELFLGITLNNRMMMPYDFYVKGALFTNSVRMNPADNASDYPNLPHINLNFKLNENLSLGIGGFLERSSNKLEETRIFNYLPAGTDTVPVSAAYNYSQDVNVSNYGGFLEAIITAGKWTFWPQVKLGLPSIGGTTSENTLTNVKRQLATRNSKDSLMLTDYNYSFNSPEGLIAKIGSHVWTEVKGTSFVAGIFATERKYQFNKVITRTTLKTDPLGSGGKTIERKTNTDSLSAIAESQMVDWWFAFQPTYSDGLYFSPEYDGGIELNRGRGPTDTDPDTVFLKQYHNFRLGVEQKVKNIWIFNDVAFRCGFIAAWTGETDKLTPKGTTTPESKETLPWKSYIWGSDYTMKAAKITAGLGFHRGRGTMDISCDLKSWNQGFLSGAPVAMATIAVDFGPTK